MRRRAPSFSKHPPPHPPRLSPPPPRVPPGPQKPLHHTSANDPKTCIVTYTCSRRLVSFKVFQCLSSRSQRRRVDKSCLIRFVVQCSSGRLSETLINSHA